MSLAPDDVLPLFEETPLQCRLSQASQIEDALAQAGDCLVIGVYTQDVLSPSIRELDHRCQGLLTRLCAANELPAKVGECLMLHEPAGLGVSRLLLVGLGKPGAATLVDVRAAFTAAARRLLESRAADVSWLLSTPSALVLPPAALIDAAVQALRGAAYKFDHYRQTRETPTLARRANLLLETSIGAPEQAALERAVAIANGVDLAKDLGNTPCNICTPNFLARAAQRMAREEDLQVEVLGEQQIEKAGMHAFLAVARGSSEAPRLITLQHRGGVDGQAPIVLIGKGLTFDSGGISIKPATDMDHMKYDMGGAAAVLGAMRACAQLKLPINVVAVVPACENMPGGNALKPGEVVRSLSGQYIEIINTDAEGRLVLCDAMTYAQQWYQPAQMIDVATLTGACVIALGSVHSGLYANDEALAHALLRAGEDAGDSAWRMPLDAAYQKQIDSPVADMVNSAGRDAGSVTAACFLSRFTEVPWAHLDIAGTAWKGGREKSGTGRPVALLTQFLITQAQAQAESAASLSARAA